MLEGTPAMESVATQDIILSDVNRDFVWYAKNNPSNTFKERLYRRLILHKLADKLRIPLTDEWNYLNIMNVIVSKHADEINKFYENCTNNI
jgi:hypothetical protein